MLATKIQLLIFAFFALLVTTSPTPSHTLEKRQRTDYLCYDNYYSKWLLGLAKANACLLVGVPTPGKYPSRFRNQEGFELLAPPPYYEYPIFPKSLYFTGKPGPDRVIFNDKCQFAGAVYHPPGDDRSFVKCDAL